MKRFKSNPTKFLKIPSSAYKIANEKGILSDLLFYYQLKSINIEGQFKRGKTFNIIQSLTKVSPSSIKCKISRLVALKWIYKSGTTYYLISYDDLWKDLGFGFTKDKKIAKSLLHIGFKDRSHIKEYIAKAEIENSLKKQSRVATVNYFKDPFFKKNNTDKLDSMCNRESFLEKIFENAPIVQFLEKVDKDKYAYQRELIQEGEITSKFCNPDVALSCLGVSKLLGYTSSVQGYYIEQDLKNLNLISIENRKVPFTFGSYSEYKSWNLHPSYIWKSNIIYKQLPNRINIL